MMSAFLGVGFGFDIRMYCLVRKGRGRSPRCVQETTSTLDAATRIGDSQTEVLAQKGGLESQAGPAPLAVQLGELGPPASSTIAELAHAASHDAANCSGIMFPSELCGCSVLNSVCHASRATRACSTLQNSFMFRYSSRTRLLNDSAKLFCWGLPSSVCRASRSAWRVHY